MIQVFLSRPQWNAASGMRYFAFSRDDVRQLIRPISPTVVHSTAAFQWRSLSFFRNAKLSAMVGVQETP